MHEFLTALFGLTLLYDFGFLLAVGVIAVVARRHWPKVQARIRAYWRKWKGVD